MLILIRRSGGIGGLEVAGAVQADELAEDLRDRLLGVLTRDRLTAAGQTPSDPGVADFYTYEVTTPEGSWTVSDGGPDQELTRALSELTSEIIRQRRSGLAGDP